MSLNKSVLEIGLEQAILNLKIEDKVKVFTGEEKNSILLKLKEFFVIGEPRVWWLSLKYTPKCFVFKQEYPYKEIVNFFDEKEDVWFIIEDNAQLLYKTKVSHVVDIISECSYFEYNIISKDYNKFLCENDHDQFLYIDLTALNS